MAATATTNKMDIPTLFSDVTPLPQSDSDPDIPPVCSISYSAEFVVAYDYFRAILRTDERSERALALTTACLRLNPANYTVWHYRRRCLAFLSKDDKDGRENESKNDCENDGKSMKRIDVDKIESDLEFADQLGGTNPKNYQLWYHRRALLECRFWFCDAVEERLAAAKKELEYVDRILGDDSKNYHAWSHRQWIIRTINRPSLWSSEIQYSHSKILSDPRNNSAWNQRWFATHEGTLPPLGGVSNPDSTNAMPSPFVLSSSTAEEEAEYALCGAKIDPFNESPWRYLVGVIMEQWQWAKQGKSVDAIRDAKKLLALYVSKIEHMRQSWEEQTEYPPGLCMSLSSALVDLSEIVLLHSNNFGSEVEGDKGDGNDTINIDTKSLETTIWTVFSELEKEDVVRRKYWRWRRKQLRTALSMSIKTDG